MKRTIFFVIGIILIILIAGIGLMYFNHTRGYTSQFKGPVSKDEPLPPALVADLELYVKRLMRQNDVPGVSMILVEGDKVIYHRGFGVRDLESSAPVTSGTLFGIGSTTKSMTAIMMASLVDDGLITWDTHLTDILPKFAMSDPQLTQAMTIRHTLCMCSGVPERKEAISVEYRSMKAENVIEMLASVPRSGSFGNTFNYSSPMVAAGGYIAAMAAGGKYGHLAQAYADVMQERLFDPLGMTVSTFSIEKAVASGNYATPYYSSLTDYEAVPPELEGIFTPMAPAGALWSNTDDLGKYLVMLLNGGVASDGKRVVSQENLTYLWKPQIAIDDTVSYGLGWYVENYHGLTVIHHCGGTVGFASELVVIPDLDIGFALLANRLDMVKPIGRMATYRLLEMLTGSEQVYDQGVHKSAWEVEKQIITLSLVTRKRVNPDKIAPFLGSYHNTLLGDIKLVLHADHTLWIDFGEYESAIRPLVLEENQYIFFDSIFIGKTIQMTLNPDGTPRLSWSGNEDTYVFEVTFR